MKTARPVFSFFVKFSRAHDILAVVTVVARPQLHLIVHPGPQAGAAEPRPSSFAQVYKDHFEFVYRVARRLGTPAAEIEDVCHEVFLVVMRKLTSFKEGRIENWLYRITAHIVTSRHRRQRIRRALFSLWENQITPTDREVDAGVTRGEAESIVNEILARMTPKKRDVLVLFELEQMPGEQIAERVGCSVSTVWTRLHHARKEFHRLAKKRGYLP